MDRLAATGFELWQFTELVGKTSTASSTVQVDATDPAEIRILYLGSERNYPPTKLGLILHDTVDNCRILQLLSGQLVNLAEFTGESMPKQRSNFVSAKEPETTEQPSSPVNAQPSNLVTTEPEIEQPPEVLETVAEVQAVSDDQPAANPDSLFGQAVVKFGLTADQQKDAIDWYNGLQDKAAQVLVKTGSPLVSGKAGVSKLYGCRVNLESVTHKCSCRGLEDSARHNPCNHALGLLQSLDEAGGIVAVMPVLDAKTRQIKYADLVEIVAAKEQTITSLLAVIADKDALIAQLEANFAALQAEFTATETKAVSQHQMPLEFIQQMQVAA